MAHSPEEYEKRQKELQDLAVSIDLWKHASRSERVQAGVANLFEELEAKTYEFECAFMDMKLDMFRKISAKLKGK